MPSFLEGFSKGSENILPILMKVQEVKRADKMAAVKAKMESEKLDLEKIKLSNEIENEKAKRKIGTLKDINELAVQSGNSQLYSKSLMLLNKELGLDPYTGANIEAMQGYVVPGTQTFPMPTTDFQEKQALEILKSKVGGWKPSTKEEAIEVKKAGKSPQMTEAALTQRALLGDKETQGILDAMQKRKLEIAKEGGVAVVDARLGSIDLEGTARAIVEGRENIENVKNTFGVPVQEAVRKKVFEIDPDFNFQVPRANIKALQSSLTQQQKQRGMMGSFVKNLNKQVDRVDTITKDIISRVGIRALDLPIRELKTRFVGSGHERVLESYLIEISNEIGKLSTGSAASIRELSTDAQERWSKIHDPNLSFKELKKILDETRLMGNMRLESTQDEIDYTMGLIKNNKPKKEEKKESSGKRFVIIKVE